MIHEEFDAATFHWFPERFWKLLIPGLFDAYKTSYELSYREFAKPEADNVLGFNRRGKVEGNLRGTADLFPDMMTTSVERPNGPWNHTEVRSGPMILTASSVSTPCEMVDRALFRVSLAAENNALQFPGLEETPDQEAGVPLYGVIVHSRYRGRDAEEDKQYAYLPGSAYLAFPAVGFDYYRHRIDLFNKFAAVVKDLTPNEWDEEAQILYLRRARYYGTA